MQSCGRIPLISPWLYRRAVRKTALRAGAGDVAATRELADIFSRTADPAARMRAREALLRPATPQQASCLCTESLLSGHAGLASLVREGAILPEHPPERALFLFCTGRTGELAGLDPEDHHPLLAAGYAAAPAPVRALACRESRRNGSCAILARALAGRSVTRDAGRWSYPEWEVVLKGFEQEKRWDELWLLSVLAPVPLSLCALACLRAAGWTPSGDDIHIWEDLVRELPEHWTYPVPSGERPAACSRPAGQAVRLAFSPDGSLLLAGSCDGHVTVSSATGGTSAADIPAGEGSVRVLAVTQDNALVLAGTDDGKVRCHARAGAALLWTWQGDTPAFALALSPESRSVQVGDEGGILHILGTRDGQPLYRIPLPSPRVTCLAVSADGACTACGHADGTVSLVRPGERTGVRTLTGSAGPVRSLSFCEDGKSCLALYESGPPVLWDTGTGMKTGTFDGTSGRAACSAVTVQGGWFAVGGSDNLIRVYRFTSPAPALTIPFYSRQATALAAAPDGSLLAAGFHDGTIRVYGMPAGTLLRDFKGHKKTVATCTIAPDSSRLATASWDGTTKLWRLPDCGILRTWDAHAGAIAALAGPAGTLLAAVTEDGTARMIDSADGGTISTLDLYTPQIRAAALSCDGAYLAAAGADGTLRTWQVRDGSLLASGERGKTSRRCLQFLPGNGTLLAGGWDGTCRIIRATDGSVLTMLRGHTSTVTCCTASADGSLIATGSNDTTVRLWRAGEETAYAVLTESRSEVGAVALAPDATLCAAGSADGTLRIYRLPAGILDGEICGIAGAVTSLAFTPDGCTLAAGSDTGVCAICSLPALCLIRTIPAHTGRITGLAVLPDGRTLVTAGADGLCRFHALPLLPFPARADPGAVGDAAAQARAAGRKSDRNQWAFLHSLLAARFRGEIGICPPLDVPGCYDIQIVG